MQYDSWVFSRINLPISKKISFSKNNCFFLSNMVKQVLIKLYLYKFYTHCQFIDNPSSILKKRYSNILLDKDPCFELGNPF